MRKTPEDFYNLFCDKFLPRCTCVILSPRPLECWFRFLLILYGVASDMTGRRYKESQPTVAQLLEEWSDGFTCRLFERFENVLNADDARINFTCRWPPIKNDVVLCEYVELAGITSDLEKFRLLEFFLTAY